MKEVKRFLGEVWLELGRVEWPKMQEFIGATTVALFLIAVFAIYLGLVDRGVQWVLQKILTLGS